MTDQTTAVLETGGYEAPALVKLGSLEALTLGHTNGAKTDAFFPAGTPRGDVTFS